MVYIKRRLLLLMGLIISLPCFSQGIYQAYHGNLHSHTSVSDGTGTPAEAFAYARDSAGLDFLAVTDHLEQIEEIIFISEEWTDMQDAADAATANGTFVGIAGWEWGSPVHGHVNVFNTGDLITDAVNLWYTTDLPAFYNWVLAHPPAFAQFNHPGDETYFTNWNNFAYVDSALDNAFPLIEFQNAEQGNTYYPAALNNGWRLSPVWNQDNHSANWGNSNDCRAGLWATSLSRAALFEAINAGRTFATMDKNARIWIDLDGAAMGSEIQVQPSMSFHLLAADSDNESWISVQLYTNNGFLADLGAHNGTLDTTLNLALPGITWIYARAQQADSNYLWSAPVYLSGTIIGMAEPAENAEVFLYPNPSSGVLCIHSPYGKGRVEIFDLRGRFLCTESFENIRPLTPENLETGVYLVKVSTGGKTFTRKLVISH